MTRILRLLLIVAVALPFWQPTAAQKVAVSTIKKKSTETKLSEKDASTKVLVDIEEMAVEGVQQIKKAVETKKQSYEPQKVRKAPKTKTAAPRATYNDDETVCDGTTTDSHFPIYGLYYDWGTSSQMIFPASLFSKLKAGDQITKLTFYANSTLDQVLSLATVTVRVGETQSTSETTVESENEMTTNRTRCTEVFKGNLTTGSNTLTINFSSPYTYTGKNLIVDFVADRGGDDKSTYWYGVESTKASYYSYNGSSSSSSPTYSQGNFLPKMKVDFANESQPYSALVSGDGAFGHVEKGQSATKTITVTNTGDNAFTPVMTSNNSAFTVTSSQSGVLNSGASRNYTVTFAPTAAQSYIGLLTLTAGESEASAINATVDLSGLGFLTDHYTVAENDEETGDVPIYTLWLDAENHGQIIYPASELGNIPVGSKISAITFYANANLTSYSGTNDTPVTLKIGETKNSKYSSTSFITSGLTTSTTLSTILTGNNYVTFTFATPYEYQGNNLVIDASCSETNYGKYTENTVHWLGKTLNGASLLTYNSNETEQKNFLPRIKIDYTYVPVEVPTRDIKAYGADFYDDFSYTWVDDDGNTKTSNLIETAIKPKQIVAMIQKIYSTPEIPGNKKRGFTTTGADDEHNTVYYGGVGTISWTSDSQVSFDNDYGWNISGDWEYGESGNYQYLRSLPDLYTPEEEGLTMLLVELKDGFNSNTYTNTTAADPSQKLLDYVTNSIKSVRVLTEAKRMGNGLDAGTLYKIDCDKMNKFFLMAKGQLRWIQNCYYAKDVNESTLAQTFCDEPCYIYRNNYIDMFCDDLSHPLFYNMFEEFSPSEFDVQVPVSDVYQDLINMETFDIKHDCQSVTYIGHQFMMYGANSITDDCQDVRDLMFFIPDYRMMKWGNRDHSDHQKFLRYNKNLLPSIGLFVIKQNPITGEQIEGQETYKLHLTWDSNLLKFLPGEQGQYTLYRVITNPDGTKTYQAVGEFAPNTFEYYDNVPMQQTGQQVTYVVQGQDVGEFLSLQMSNEESYIIPGLDRAEQIRINLNRDYYFSRYDAAEQKNYYSNSLIANNTVGTNVKPQYIENGSQFKFWRATLKEVEENGVTSTVVDTEHAVNFVNATVGNYDPASGGTLTYAEVDGTQTNFSNKPYGHGYHANAETSTISIDTKNNQISTDDEVVFDGLKLYDNFSVDVSQNAHPSQYIYYVTLETAVPFELGVNGIPECATAQSGTYAYFECKWGATMRAWAWNDNGNLTGNDWPGTGTMTQVGTHNGNKVWLWTADANVKPTNIIFNWDNYSSLEQTGTYAFINGSYYRHDDTHQNDVVGVVGSNQARSNTVSIPVFKTEMVMCPISSQNVEDDVTHQFPASTKFDVKARYSSKSEILGYYIYRWADNETEATARSIYESNGDDASPQGQAGNQGEYYTVAMNTDYTDQTEDFVLGNNGMYADVTATFMDNYMVNEATAADTYTYAPVVELFAPEKAVNLSDNSDREDYNTYGGPQQMTAGGKIEVEVSSSATTGDNGYHWTMNGSTYVYYTTLLKVNVLDLPEGYEVAKVRAWRKVNAEDFLGEQAPTQNTPDYGYRTKLDSNGEFMFSNYNTTNYDPEGYDIQEGGYIGGEEDKNHIMAGTFGGKKLENGEQVPMDFVVRIYFTKTGAKAGEQPYYIAEVTATDVLTSNIPTSITGVESYRNVISEKYYNPAGIESDTPFKGVNIVVTRYSDGSTTTTKILK